MQDCGLTHLVCTYVGMLAGYLLILSTLSLRYSLTLHSLRVRTNIGHSVALTKCMPTGQVPQLRFWNKGNWGLVIQHKMTAVMSGLVQKEESEANGRKQAPDAATLPEQNSHASISLATSAGRRQCVADLQAQVANNNTAWLFCSSQVLGL